MMAATMARIVDRGGAPMGLPVRPEGRPREGGASSLLGFPGQFVFAAALHHPYVRRLGGIAAALLIWTTAHAAAALDGVHVLTDRGAALGTVTSGGTLNDLRITVDTGGDSVDSTHVWAVIGSSELRQRTNNGYWVPWNGDLADLVDNRFAADGDTIVFKVIDGSIAEDNQGITIVVGYKTNGTLKYGALGVLPGGGS